MVRVRRGPSAAEAGRRAHAKRVPVFRDLAWTHKLKVVEKLCLRKISLWLRDLRVGDGELP
eukprot:6578325-Heterocapsa_arctica.AAC.1